MQWITSNFGEKKTKINGKQLIETQTLVYFIYLDFGPIAIV